MSHPPGPIEMRTKILEFISLLDKYSSNPTQPIYQVRKDKHNHPIDTNKYLYYDNSLNTNESQVPISVLPKYLYRPVDKNRVYTYSKKEIDDIIREIENFLPETIAKERNNQPKNQIENENRTKSSTFIRSRSPSRENFSKHTKENDNDFQEKCKKITNTINEIEREREKEKEKEKIKLHIHIPEDEQQQNQQQYENNNKNDEHIYLKKPHSATNSPRVMKERVEINASVETLDDLLKLIEQYPLIENVEYSIDLKPIHAIKEPLVELHNMIGLSQLKQNILDQIIYYLQGFHLFPSKQNDYLHTVIYGPAGTGKTEVAKLIGRIFSELGILKRHKFRKVVRSDLVAGYLGQTALKTRDVIKESLGGVLFIDEAYALGNAEKRDSFSKECIDTLCEALSHYKDELMVIIAGYEEELKSCFFDYNQGLQSRFTWRFKTDEYNPNELRDIYKKKVNEAGWSLDEEQIKVEWFEQNKEHFNYFGRDMETLFSKTKIAHSRRVFCKGIEEKRRITLTDMNNGLKMFLSSSQNEKDKEKEKETQNRYMSMYM
jgi:ATP-dependent 26S proteasome regulatory subunit